MRRFLPAFIAILLAAPATAQDIWQGRSAAYFGVTFLDTSHEGQLAGPREDEAARVALVRDHLEDALVEHGIKLVDLAPVRGELDRIANPADCYGCEVRMAGRLGADYSVVAEVQKVSNLILVMNVVVRDAGTGSRVRGMVADIRGNTDESWLRGMRYVLENGIFREE